MPTQGNLLAAILIVVFGFIFVTVSARITGLIGSSSIPVSGMTIATLILTCLIFVSIGWTGSYYAPIALCVAAVVSIAATNGGATSQDLKTGYIVGAAPLFQQIGLLIGVVASALVIGVTTLYLHRVFGIGSKAIAAPQAALTATIIRGLLGHTLPWGLVLVGVFIAIPSPRPPPSWRGASFAGPLDNGPFSTRFSWERVKSKHYRQQAMRLHSCTQAGAGLRLPHCFLALSLILARAGQKRLA